jgi:threonine dehydrogenase-like Zn-dependent dehydrogenase
MKALLYPEYQRLEIAEQSRPQLGEGEVLLRVAACGICGSELEAFKKQSPRRVPPLVSGHHERASRKDHQGCALVSRPQQVSSDAGSRSARRCRSGQYRKGDGDSRGCFND